MDVHSAGVCPLCGGVMYISGTNDVFISDGDEAACGCCNFEGRFVADVNAGFFGFDEIIKNMDFKTWFSTKLAVGGFPYSMNEAFTPSEYKYVINVSDDYDDSVAQEILNAGGRYFWFPMNEHRKDIGLNSIYGAIMILHQAELAGAPVYLHCIAGKNRSRIVQQCYYYARSGHVYTPEGGERDGQLPDACARGLLPPIGEMRRFLTKLGKRLTDGDRGCFLDEIKRVTLLNF